jgi:phospholipid/cholesterol/gamma-HCH transport system substrate-binding protein
MSSKLHFPSNLLGLKKSPDRSFQLGLMLVAVVLALAVPLFLREPIAVLLSGGETVTARFAADNVVRAYKTEVKVAGVPVGKVVSIERGDHGGATVEMKISDEAYAALGSAPDAEIRPTTLLGGRYYINLTSGGLPGTPDGDIPVERTHLPVELEEVAAALQPDARTGGQAAIGALDGTLTAGGADALRSLLADAPGVLRPAAGVLEGVRGERPTTDLPDLVGNLEATARVLTDRQGELEGIVSDLDTVSAVLARRSGDINATLDALPAALDSADKGLNALDGTLDELRATAGPATEIAEELNELLDAAGPVVARARPTVANLREVLGDLRPLVDDLASAAPKITTVSDNVRGPVLDRVNGPIIDTLNAPFAGSGAYAGNGADYPLYQAIGYMFSNLNRSAKYTDGNGAVASLQFGLGPGSLAGLPVSPEQTFQGLLSQQGGGR